MLSGIHAPNGPGGEALNDVPVVTVLHGQAGDVSGPVKLVRLYSPNILAENAEDWARKAIGFDHAIPFNEANLPYETGQEWDGFNLERTKLQVQTWWYQFAKFFRQYGGQWLHFPAWSPYDGTVGPFLAGADYYDVHCYAPDAAGLLACLDMQLAGLRTVGVSPERVAITEWNCGCPWADVDPAEVTAFLDGCAARGIYAATAFIYRWDNPDASMPNYDLAGTEAERAIREWRETSTRVESPAAHYSLGPKTEIRNGDMTDTERAELNRVAGIFDNWAKLRRDQAAAAAAYGYGIHDALAVREADELSSAVDSLRSLANPQ